MMFFWLLLIPLVLYLFNQSEHSNVENNSPRKNALDILRERYARGEIELADFEERQRELRKEA